MKAVDATFTKD